MSKTAKQEGILLLGSYGRGNLGDDAFLLAALKLFDGYRLFINAARTELLPRAVRGQVTSIATNSNKDIMQKLRVFRSVRHIVYCGGDVWVELYENRFPRQSLYKMVVVNLLARLFGKQVHYLGVGIGNLQGYSLFLARLSARMANSIVLREPRSARVLNTGNVQVLPDLVTNLDITPQTKSRKRSEKYVIGISILYHLPDPEENFPRLIAILKDTLGSLPKQQFRIVLFPMLISSDDEHDDAWASVKLHEALPEADISIFEGREVEEYVAALRDVDLLIGTRLHASIIAMLAGVPCLGISYRPKVAQFFEMNGLGEYSINLTDLNAALLNKKLQHIFSHHDQAVDDFRGSLRKLTEGKGYQSFVEQF
jgi:polysaccharide pyruvyl transferase WcaK-like protein